MLLLIRDIVKQAVYNLDLPDSLERKRLVRPKHNPTDGAKMVLMAQYFGLSNRATQGYMLLFKEKLQLTTTYSYKTIERAYNDMETRQILEEVFELTNVPIKDLEHEFGPDTTWLSTSSKQNYENDRAKDQTSRGMKKFLLWWALNTSSFRRLGMQASLQIMSRRILSLCCVKLLIGLVGWIWCVGMRLICRGLIVIWWLVWVR